MQFNFQVYDKFKLYSSIIHWFSVETTTVPELNNKKITHPHPPPPLLNHMIK